MKRLRRVACWLQRSHPEIKVIQRAEIVEVSETASGIGVTSKILEADKVCRRCGRVRPWTRNGRPA